MASCPLPAPSLHLRRRCRWWRACCWNWLYCWPPSAGRTFLPPFPCFSFHVRSAWPAWSYCCPCQNLCLACCWGLWCVWRVRCLVTTAWGIALSYVGNARIVAVGSSCAVLAAACVARLVPAPGFSVSVVLDALLTPCLPRVHLPCRERYAYPHCGKSRRCVASAGEPAVVSSLKSPGLCSYVHFLRGRWALGRRCASIILCRVRAV